MSKRLRRRSQLASQKSVQRAQQFAQRGDLADASDLLEAHLQKYPHDSEALDHLGELYAATQNAPGMWGVVRRQIALEPDESHHYFNALNVCMVNHLPFSALIYADTYLTRWSDGEFVREMRESKTKLDAICAEIQADDPAAADAQPRDLMLHEEAQMLLSLGQYDEARVVVQHAIERLPKAVAPRNNLSLIQGMTGQLDDAVKIAEQVIGIDPSNVQARCNLVNFRMRLGQLNEAEPIITELKAEKPRHSLELMKLIETFAYLGEHQVIVDLYEQYQNMLSMSDRAQAMTWHLAAVAYARLDHLKQAKSLWKKVLSIDPDLGLAHANLEDLKRPVGQQSGAWAFTVDYWIPPVWIDEIRVMAERIMAGRGGTKRELTRLMDKLPELKTIVAILLERGDPNSRTLALHIAIEAGLSALREFALGRWGTDDQRMKAAQAATELGLLPRGKPVTLYSNGEPRELLLMAYEISAEPTLPKLTKSVRRLLEKTHHMLQEGNAEKARQLAEEGVKQAPDIPAFLNYLAIAYSLLGEQEKSLEVIRHTAVVHPDYTFARTAMAKICVQEEKFDEAAEWLDPLLERSTFHFSEFRAFCDAQISLLIAKGEHEAAESWIEIWSQMDLDE